MGKTDRYLRIGRRAESQKIEVRELIFIVAHRGFELKLMIAHHAGIVGDKGTDGPRMKGKERQQRKSRLASMAWRASQADVARPRGPWGCLAQSFRLPSNAGYEWIIPVVASSVMLTKSASAV